MKDKKGRRKPPRTADQAVGFWDRSKPFPAIVSIRHSSKLARTLAFLRKIVGGTRKED